MRRNPLSTVTLINRLRTSRVRICRKLVGRGACLGVTTAQLNEPTRNQTVWLSRSEARRMRDAITAWLERQ